MDSKVKKLLDKYGETYAEEIGIDLKNTPSALFQWLYSSMLFSARIGSDISVNAARELISRGWTTAEKMDDTTWNMRVDALNKAHYTRYQEKTSTFLGDISKKLLDEYNGDLRKLKDEAANDKKKLRELLKEFKGEGDVGVDIFFREIQQVWTSLFPFLDEKASKAAQKINLPKSAEGLADKVNNNKNQYVKLLSALVRADLARDYDLEKEEEDNPDNELNEMSKPELYEKAQKQNIPGRSNMSKKELVQALG